MLDVFWYIVFTVVLSAFIFTSTRNVPALCDEKLNPYASLSVVKGVAAQQEDAFLH